MKIKVLIGLAILFLGILISGIYLWSPPKQMAEYTQYYRQDSGSLRDGQVSVTFFGVSTLLIEDGKTQLLIDGFFSRPSLLQVLSSKISTDSAVVTNLMDQYRMDKVKAVFVTHSHYEHAMDAAYVAKRADADLLGSFSTSQIGLGGGLSKDQVQVFDINKHYRYGDFEVRVLSSKHSPATAYNDDIGEVIYQPLVQPANATEYVEGGSFDFLITHKSHTLYIKPSANYVSNALKDIRADVLLLGVGGLANQKNDFQKEYFHQTIDMLLPKLVVPLHWDNFFHSFSTQLQMNPRGMDRTDKGIDSLIEYTRSRRIEFSILQGGQRMILF